MVRARFLGSDLDLQGLPTEQFWCYCRFSRCSGCGIESSIAGHVYAKTDCSYACDFTIALFLGTAMPTAIGIAHQVTVKMRSSQKHKLLWESPVSRRATPVPEKKLRAAPNGKRKWEPTPPMSIRHFRESWLQDDGAVGGNSFFQGFLC